MKITNNSASEGTKEKKPDRITRHQTLLICDLAAYNKKIINGGMLIMTAMIISLALVMSSITSSDNDRAEFEAYRAEVEASILEQQAALDLRQEELEILIQTLYENDIEIGSHDEPLDEFEEIEEEILVEVEDSENIVDEEEVIDEIIPEEYIEVETPQETYPYLTGDALQSMMDANAITMKLSAAEYLSKRAYETGMPLEILFSVAYSESRFVETAVNNSSGCYGLFQIKYTNFSWLTGALGTTINNSTILNPETNIDAMLYIMAECRDKYSNSTWHMVLMRYNAGPAGANTNYFSKGIYQSSYSQGIINRAISYGMDNSLVNL